MTLLHYYTVSSRIILWLCLLTCVSCSIPPFKPQTINKIFTVEIIIDNNIIFKEEKVAGLAQCAGTSPNRYCILTVPSIEDLDDFDWYYWGKELGHGYYDNYHEGVADIY